MSRPEPISLGGRPEPAAPARITPAPTADRGPAGKAATTPVTSGADPALLDAMRAIVNRHELRHGGTLPVALAVTGPGSGTDSSAVARALAGVLADDLGRATCLVDLGWIGAAQPQRSRRPGQSDAAPPLDEPTFTRADDTGSLTELRFPPVPPDRRNAFVHSAGMTALMGEVVQRFEHVVFDVPPVLDSPGALALMTHAHAALIVVKHRSTPLATIERILTAIEPTPTIAVVVSGFRPSIPRTVRRLFGG